MILHMSSSSIGKIRISLNRFKFCYRTALELIAAGILMIFFARFGEVDGISGAMFDCFVHEVPFNCVIPNHRFFMVIYIMAVVMLFCYFLLTTYNLLWLMHPKVPRLERILSGYATFDLQNIIQVICDSYIR